MATTRPIGNVDLLAPNGAGTVWAVGWAGDRAVPAPSAITLLVDGNPFTTFPADGVRPDVGAAYPGLGPVHGFSKNVTGIPAGPHRACLVAHNIGAGGGSTRLGCVDLTVTP
jgi:hypothetical protein